MPDIKQELWKISEDFAQHLLLRDLLLSDGIDTGPIEQTIRDYFTHDVTRDKIDSVIGYIRYCEEMMEAARKESIRCCDLADSYATKAKWLKDCAKGVLEASGQKALEGLTAGKLALRANGGKQAVTITNAWLVPEELVTYQGTISGKAWDALKQLVLDSYPGMSYLAPEEAATSWIKWHGRADVQMERIPHKGRIGEALSKPCAKCNGTGKEITPLFADPCPECGGDGLARVPGARLEVRGSSVVVR